MKPNNTSSLRSSLKHEAIHIALLAKSLVNETHIYTVNESLEILKLKMNTLAAFSVRSKLDK